MGTLLGFLSRSLFSRSIPPTEKVNDIIQTSYAPLFKRNGISIVGVFGLGIIKER